MFLSIITPFKGEIKKLEKTLESYKEFLVNLKFDYEILLITAEYIKVLPKLKNFEKLKINLLKEDESKGIYTAMNIGINSSKGKYLIFINCGDIITKSFTDLIISKKDLIKENKKLFSFTVSQKKRNSNSLRRRIPPRSKYAGLISNPWSHCGILFPGKEIRNSNYEIKYKCGADYEKVLNLLFKNSLKYKSFFLKKPAIILDIDCFSFENKKICLQDLRLIKRKYFKDKNIIIKIYSNIIYLFFYFEQFLKKNIQ